MTDLTAGIAAFENQNYHNALTILTPLANQGSDEAQCILGCMYQLGLGVQANSAIAADWYQRSAEQGNGLAANNLAGLILMGYEGKAPNRNEASQWYDWATRQGFLHSPTAMNVFNSDRHG
ncbi:MAG: tetratricopeptide repeat protein [Leptolyngbyaceae cyanobacterium bins.349]|nr:tetratricopeptide repeat protein [Leptolyngbyaceae cyanobacterium bins.349]